MSDVQKPVDRGVRVNEAAEFLGISRSTLFVLMNSDPTFPRGAKLGRSRVWLLSDLFTWLRNQGKKRN